MAVMPFRLRFARILKTLPHTVILSLIASAILLATTDAYWLFLVWTVGFVFQLLILSVIIGRWKRFKIRRSIDRQNSKPLSALLRIPFQKISGTSYMTRVSCVEDLRSASAVPVVSIVDAACQIPVEDIEITRDLIEPEPLAIGGLTRWGCSSAFGFAITLFFVWALFSAGSSLAIDPIILWSISILGVLAGAWNTPIRGKLHRVFSRNAGQNIMGPGFFAYSNTSKWTVDDSIMVVGLKGIQVHTEVIVILIGPAGAKDLYFNSTKDREFIRLWKVWNHPVPRTELLEDLF